MNFYAARFEDIPDAAQFITGEFQHHFVKLSETLEDRDGRDINAINLTVGRGHWFAPNFLIYSPLGIRFNFEEEPDPLFVKTGPVINLSYYERYEKYPDTHEEHYL